MIEETTSEGTVAAVAPPTPKIHRIGLYNRLAVMISGGFIALTLLIGWMMWVTVYRQGIDYYIKTFNEMVPNGIKISFEELIFIIFIVSGIAIGLVVFYFLFIKTKNSFSALISLISFIFAAVLVIGFVIFFIIRFDVIKFLIKNDNEVTINTTGLAIAVFLPLTLAFLSAFFLLGNSLWLLINISSKYNFNALLLSTMKSKKQEPAFENTTVSQPDEILITLASQEPETLTLDASQQSNIQSQVEFESTPSTNESISVDNNVTPQLMSNATYTISIDQSTSTGAAVSEAVVVNHNLESTSEEPQVASNVNTSIYSGSNNDKPTPLSSISKYDDLSDENQSSTVQEPEILSDATTSSPAVSYNPQNQGGFDVQGEVISKPDESEFRPETLVANDYDYTAKQKTAVKPPSLVEKKVLKPKPTIEKVVSKQQPAKSKPLPNVSVNHWTLDQIQKVWEKAERISGVSDKLYRKDYAGAWMFRDSFTMDLSEASNEKTYSWTIILHRPASQSGTTELYNLDPMNVVNAKSKGEDYPRWTTKLSSKGNENIIKEQNWKART